MDRNDQVFQNLKSTAGMSVLKPNAFEETLLELIIPLFDYNHITPVLCCGLVGAREGWEKADYSMVPCQIGEINGAHCVTAVDKRLEVVVITVSVQESPADVMCGEETQIASHLKQDPNFCGAICLPGTHTK